MKQRIVVVGGGFAGFSCVRELRKVDAEVTLIDKRNFHLFQPLLYQVATGDLSPANICSPLRVAFQQQKNTRVLLGQVNDIDLTSNELILDSGRLGFDAAVIATGAGQNYFGHPEWEQHAPSLKSIEDATEIRRKILLAFEAAERESDPAQRKKWLTFVIVGAGPTGVEMAGAISEIAKETLRRDFRQIAEEEPNILLIEAGAAPLEAYSERLEQYATSALEKLGVTVRVGQRVIDIRSDHVIVKTEQGEERIDCHSRIWAAGVSASPLGESITRQTGCELDRAGRVRVNADLSVPGAPHVFVLGDTCTFQHGTERPLPGLAPVAIQQGRYVGKLLRDRQRGRETKPFEYNDRGSMAVIGRYKAVGQTGGREFKGLFAWFIWLTIHLVEISLFRNRVLVFMQWGWTFLTRVKSARLITGYPLDDEHQQEEEVRLPEIRDERAALATTST